MLYNKVIIQQRKNFHPKATFKGSTLRWFCHILRGLVNYNCTVE